MKNIKYIILIFFIVYPTNCIFGNDYIENLTVRLYDSKGTEKVDILNQLATYYRENDNKKLHHYSYRALQHAKSLNYEKGIANALMNLGIYYASTGNYDQSELTFQNALDIYQSIDDDIGIARAYMSLGRLSRYNGDLKKAIIYNNFALKVSNIIKENIIISDIYLNLGVIYDDVFDYKNSYDYYNKALALKIKHKDDKIKIAKIYNNIGQLFFKLNDIDKSLKFYYLAQELLQYKQNKKLESNLYNNISLIFLDKGIYDSAMIYQEKSLKIGVVLNDKPEMQISYLNLGNIEMVTGNYKKAEKYLNLSRDIAIQISDHAGMADSYQYLGILNMNLSNYVIAMDYIEKSNGFYSKSENVLGLIDNYKFLSDIHKNMGNSEKALEFLKLSNALSDSVSTIKNNDIIELMAMKFEAEQMIEDNKHQDILHKSETMSLYIILSLSFLTIIILTISIRKIIKKKRLLEGAKLEIERRYSFEIGVYHKLTKEIRPSLFPLAVNIAKINHLKEFEDLNKSYMGLATELDDLTESCKNIISN